jgi:hypothetical protein
MIQTDPAVLEKLQGAKSRYGTVSLGRNRMP